MTYKSTHIRITKRNNGLQVYGLLNDTTKAFLKSSKLIDWNDVDQKLLLPEVIAALSH
jgi:hypothetical protein